MEDPLSADWGQFPPADVHAKVFRPDAVTHAMVLHSWCDYCGDYKAAMHDCKGPELRGVCIR